DVAADDLAVAALARGERPTTPLPESFDPDGQEAVVLAALRGHLQVVVDAVGPDFRGVIGGSPEGTLLHHAAWLGDAETVQALLIRGADTEARVDVEFDTPLGWAAVGSENHEEPGRDYVAVAELLEAAGNRVEPRFLEVAEGEFCGWLEERL